MVVNEESLNVSTYNWLACYEDIDPSRNPVYYFELQDGDDTAVSRYFNISDSTEDGSDQLDLASSASVSSTTEPASSSTQSRTVPEATVTQVIQSSGSDLLAESIAGIVFGAVGATMVLVGGLWWWWRRKAEVRSHGTPGRTRHLFVLKPEDAQESEGEIHEVAATEEPPRIY
ncbi:hypothetical protein N0V84_009738 [Fusarium piperis]|uniref:Mid2 domain-containing protein n=1 Tax=Fusarium piperis TaxID=1435070 RepID=A0A9W8W5S6_9HYPO|nr:hypothetical protein N0V84_009738 [Fusarium piperis]